MYVHKELRPFFDFALEWRNAGRSNFEIFEALYSKGATMAIAQKTLEKIGVSFSEMDVILRDSIAWKDYSQSVADLLIDLVRLESPDDE